MDPTLKRNAPMVALPAVRRDAVRHHGGMQLGKRASRAIVAGHRLQRL